MKILKAPNKNTVDRQSSAGIVSFVEGIATKFTAGQEEHFTLNMPGYSVEEIPDPPKPTNAASKAASVKSETVQAPNPDADTSETPEGGSDGSESSGTGTEESGTTGGSGEGNNKDLGEHFENAPDGSLKVELPVSKSGKEKDIVPFCKTYGIDPEGTAKELLLRIYADPRFEK